MFFKKKAFNICFSILSFIFFISTFSKELVVSWKETFQDPENGSIVISCDYDAKEYILSDRISVLTSPLKQHVSVVLDKQPHELFVPNKNFPMLVLKGTGKLKLIIPQATISVDKLLISYVPYDIKDMKEGKLKTIVLNIPPDGEVIEFNSNDNALQDNGFDESSGDISSEYSVLNRECNACYDLYNTDSGEVSESKGTLESILNIIINALGCTNSKIILFVIVFALGILMSLTPCIYPMIPITIGILGIGENEDFKKRFVVAFLYILGISVTFSILGLFAVSGSVMVGGLFANKAFVSFVLLLFIYMTFSMLGFYEMKSFSPSFSSSGYFGNIYLKAVTYGLFSGSFMSPCVSPGLMAVLSIAASYQSYFIGFVTLLFFGLGLGTPLFVIIVLFNRLQAIVRPGAWMNSIKKIIGLFLLVLCSRYMLILFPIYVSNIFILISLVVLIRKMVFSDSKQEWHDKIVFLVISILMIYTLYNCYKNYLMRNKKYSCEAKSFFMDNFEKASSLAKKEGKLLFVDVTASWCSICNELNEKHFSNNEFFDTIKNSFIAVKIDLTNGNNSKNEEFARKYKIRGIPLILVINPEDGEALKSFGSEVLDISTDSFAKQLIEAYP
jgi:thiol:disulfide interchange protein